jgi:hypothetical protein
MSLQAGRRVEVVLWAKSGGGPGFVSFFMSSLRVLWPDGEDVISTPRLRCVCGRRRVCEGVGDWTEDGMWVG